MGVLSRTIVLSLGLLLVLTGCGGSGAGGDDSTATPTPTPGTDPTPTATAPPAAARAWTVAQREGFDTNDDVRGRSQVILRSDDDGATWTSVFANDTGFAIGGLTFADRLHGWMTTAARRVLRSVDGGATWQAAPSVPVDEGSTLALGDVSFIDTERGIVLARGAEDEPTVFYTDDGGDTWLPSTFELTSSEPLLPTGLNGVCWTTSGQGLLVGSDRVPVGSSFDEFVTAYLSTDAGRSWQEISDRLGGGTPLLARPESLACAGATDLWIGVTDGLLHSTDAGATWTDRLAALGSNAPDTIDFATPLVGWALADETIHATTDGGTTWTPQATLELGVVASLSGAIAAVDADRAIVAGQATVISPGFGGRGLDVFVRSTRSGGTDGWPHAALPDDIERLSGPIVAP